MVNIYYCNSANRLWNSGTGTVAIAFVVLEQTKRQQLQKATLEDWN